MAEIAGRHDARSGAMVRSGISNERFRKSLRRAGRSVPLLRNEA
jgi:hypothetical protein